MATEREGERDGGREGRGGKGEREHKVMREVEVDLRGVGGGDRANMTKIRQIKLSINKNFLIFAFSR